MGKQESGVVHSRIKAGILAKKSKRLWHVAKGGVKMAIRKKDADKMKSLAREGKQISKIVAEDFPEYDYWDVYSEVYGSGEQSAQGVKWMITNRLNQLIAANAQDRQRIINELNELIWYLYDNYRSNQRKLENIRQVLGK